jgi:hypothetical protein
MSLSVASLLVHDTDVPVAARDALRAASAARGEDRRAYLEDAARSLAHEADLNCPDARELVGL